MFEDTGVILVQGRRCLSRREGPRDVAYQRHKCIKLITGLLYCLSKLGIRAEGIKGASWDLQSPSFLALLEA